MPYGVNRITGKPGPAPDPPRDGDKKQARHRVNMEIRSGDRPRPNDLPCTDCGHVWAPGERRHEYDHHLGYDAVHHGHVQPVCTTCHAQRSNAGTRCKSGRHERTEGNTGLQRGRPFCTACRRERERRTRTAQWWRARRKRKKDVEVSCGN